MQTIMGREIAEQSVAIAATVEALRPIVMSHDIVDGGPPVRVG